VKRSYICLILLSRHFLRATEENHERSKSRYTVCGTKSETGTCRTRRRISHQPTATYDNSLTPVKWRPMNQVDKIISGDQQRQLAGRSPMIRKPYRFPSSQNDREWCGDNYSTSSLSNHVRWHGQAEVRRSKIRSQLPSLGRRGTDEQIDKLFNSFAITSPILGLCTFRIRFIPAYCTCTHPNETIRLFLHVSADTRSHHDRIHTKISVCFTQIADALWSLVLPERCSQTPFQSWLVVPLHNNLVETSGLFLVLMFSYCRVLTFPIGPISGCQVQNRINPLPLLTLQISLKKYPVRTAQ